MDTGPKVQGRHIDIYMWSCHEALELGRRSMQIVVLRLGWNPKASTPSLIDRLFRQREKAQELPPAPPRPTAATNSARSRLLRVQEPSPRAAEDAEHPDRSAA